MSSKIIEKVKIEGQDWYLIEENGEQKWTTDVKDDDSFVDFEKRMELKFENEKQEILKKLKKKHENKLNKSFRETSKDVTLNQKKKKDLEKKLMKAKFKVNMLQTQLNLNNGKEDYLTVALFLLGEIRVINKKKIIEYFEKSGNQDVKVLLFLASAYFEGHYIEQNYEKVFYYNKLIADKKNDADAQYLIGKLYYLGEGCEKNLELAEKYSFLAYENGIKEASDTLIRISYDVGLQNMGKCFEILEKIKNGSSYFKLALLYKALLDSEKYYKYLELSSEKFYIPGMITLANCYEKGEHFEKNLELSKLLRNTAYNKVIEEEEEFYKVACYFFKMDDYENAHKFFELSVNQDNHVKSNFHLGFLYLNGLGCERDYDKAFKYIQTSASKEYPKAFIILGDLYKNGLGVEQSDEKSFENYLEAIKYKCEIEDYEYARCCFNIAKFYFEGKICKKDDEKSFDFFKKSVEYGCKEANYYLGLCYKNGIGCKIDNDKAIKYFEISSINGDQNPNLELEKLFN